MDIVKIVMFPESGNPYAPRKCEWLPVVLAAAGLATSLAGGAAASDKARRAQREQEAQAAKDEAWYKRRYNEDYVDTAAGQNLVRRAKQFAKDQWKKAAGAQAVSGGTDAATQMAKDAGNKMVGDTLANIAANDTHRKDSVDSTYRNLERQNTQARINTELAAAQNVQNAAGQAGNALMSMGGALAQTSTSGNNLAGGNNNGTDVVHSDGGNGAAVQMNNLTPGQQSALDKINAIEANERNYWASR